MSLLDTYRRAPVTIVAGEGCILRDDRGRAYLDFIGGIAVCALGHSHPAIAEAVATQARTLVHASNLYHHQPSEQLAAELARRSGMAGVFFCNSGTEANEAAIKLARKLAYRRGKPRTNDDSRVHRFVSRAHAGRTRCDRRTTRIAKASRRCPKVLRSPPFNDVAALERAIDERVAAFIVEPVQGESGIHPASAAFLAAARSYATNAARC